MTTHSTRAMRREILRRRSSVAASEKIRSLADLACFKAGQKRPEARFVRVGSVDPESDQAATETRSALDRHVDAVATMALRSTVERTINPRRTQTATWRRGVLADLNRPRRAETKLN